MNAAFLKFCSFGDFDLAVDLGQRLLAAHRQDRVAEGDDDADHADQAEPIRRRARLRASARSCRVFVASVRLAEEAERIDLRLSGLVRAVGVLCGRQVGQAAATVVSVRPPSTASVDAAPDRS